jgi:3-methyladenine DNA glycosylase/8-oxoguanine DNA glycosylase
VSGPAGPTRPRLVAVPSPEPASPTGSGALPEAGASPARRDRRVWILAVLLGLCALGFALENRRAAQLAGRLAETEGRLQAAEARLSAYDAYLGAVRSRVGALRDQLEGLAGVLAADPSEGAPRE